MQQRLPEFTSMKVNLTLSWNPVSRRFRQIYLGILIQQMPRREPTLINGKQGGKESPEGGPEDKTQAEKRWKALKKKRRAVSLYNCVYTLYLLFWLLLPRFYFFI